MDIIDFISNQAESHVVKMYKKSSYFQQKITTDNNYSCVGIGYSRDKKIENVFFFSYHFSFLSFKVWYCWNAECF